MSDLEPTEIEFRRAARERALELLYETEIKGLAISAVLESLPLSPVPLAEELVRGVDRNGDRIDEVLARRVAPRWSMARLAAVDRAILRLGTYELMEASDRSQAVIINEAVVLARRFGTDDSPRFVNGVLSAVSAEVRPGANPGSEVAEIVEDAAAASFSEAREPQDGWLPRLIDALVIDLDGVIRHWDEEALPAAEQHLGLASGTIAAAAFEPERLGRAMRGEITFAAWAAEIGAAVGADHDAASDEVAAAFTDVGWRIDELVMDLVDQARERVPVALLSNASSRLLDDLRHSDIVDRFDAVIASADIGVCKPAPEAFVAAAGRLGVAPERCLYIDDTDENVAAASAVGMRAVRYTDVDQLAAELAAAGLLLT